MNKVAVLMNHWEHNSAKPLKHIIVGTDVNRDDGLCSILRKSDSNMDVVHVDIFDSRVYPWHDEEIIADEFHSAGTPIEKDIHCWRQNNFEYYAVDLKSTTRINGQAIHPSILFALSKIKENIESAKQNHQKIAIVLPTGWDSHKDETADCGKYVGYKMSKKEAAQCRFNDNDLSHFYDELFQLYNENKEHIAGMYWCLEGGYHPPMYKEQVQLMLRSIDQQLVHQEVKSEEPGGIQYRR